MSLAGTLTKTHSQNEGDVLRSSFSFIPGVGSLTEELLWGCGIFTWDNAYEKLGCVRVGSTKRDVIRDYLLQAEEALKLHDINFFAKKLPRNEHWRLYRLFRDRTLFLDIETTGLSLYYDYITLVGTFDGLANSYYIKDHNLNGVCDQIRECDILVTFNGTNFDVPFLKKELPQITIPLVHLDLRYLLRSVGLSGPLKEIEKKFGIDRPDDLRRLGGRDAVVLWRRYLNGDDESFRKLLRYNAFDTSDLVILLDHCCKVKETRIATKMSRAAFQMSFGEVPEHTFHFDRESILTSNTFIPNLVAEPSGDNVIRVQSGKQTFEVDRRRIRKPEISIDAILKRLEEMKQPPLVLGIDLSGSESRPTGICILNGHTAHLDTVETDAQLLTLMKDVRPSVISIDSPLGLPEGRCCANDNCECRQYGITRACERILKKRGISVYPCLIPSMQSLTTRGMKIAGIARQEGLCVIESYPGAAQDILGMPRKRVDLEGLQVDLTNLGIVPISKRNVISHHEIDALTSALVGYFYLSGDYEALGNDDEGYLVVPELP
ncbi:MAG TPA: ribonuclease H-like domain-containing protein [Dehalococcoidales bacterium]